MPRGRLPKRNRLGFTARQYDCVRLAVAGHNEKEISRALGMSQSTVSTHLDHARSIVGANNRTALVREVLRRARVDVLSLIDRAAGIPAGTGD